jgi:hypothetical protein
MNFGIATSYGLDHPGSIASIDIFLFSTNSGPFGAHLTS